MAQLRGLPLNGSQPSLWQPDSGWEPYRGPLPRLQGVDVAIDTETRDDGLATERGPGWVYDAGYLCGVSADWGAGRLYVPVRHPDTECRPMDEVASWVDSVLRDCPVWFFNLGYDMAWLLHSGVTVWPERAHDAQIMQAMLDENLRDYSLDGCCARHGIAGKDPSLLEAAARAYGVDPKKGLWRMPARYVGPYAEQDATATLALGRTLLPLVDAEHMRAAYQTEIDLVPALYDMRRRGIRVNTGSAESAQAHVRTQKEDRLSEIGRLVGRRVTMPELLSPVAVGRVFEAVGITCPKTPKTKLPSVTKDWLAGLDHPMGVLVREARQFNDLAEKFIGTYILGHQHRGRVHAVINQLRTSDDDGDNAGARTQRLSYASPPLHQMPARPTTPAQELLVAMIREIFEPESGEMWAAPDYSGQEPRIMVHLAAMAKIKGAAEIAAIYNADPDTDYHTMVAAIIGLPRKKAKDINQGIAYGMGLVKLARVLRCSEEEAQAMLDIYEDKLPYIGGLTQEASNLAKERGWIRLLDGARCHFDEWQPRGSRYGDTVWGKERAKKRWPNTPIERAYTYRAANRAAQGGAARQMKRAMVECHRAKLHMLVQMHDELGLSVGCARDALLARDLMINTTKLCVPVKVDLEVGPTWGRAKYPLEKFFQEAA